MVAVRTICVVLVVLVAQQSGVVAGARIAYNFEKNNGGDAAAAGAVPLNLEDVLAYQERENEAVAQLYENVLDVLQVRRYHHRQTYAFGGEKISQPVAGTLL